MDTLTVKNLSKSFLKNGNSLAVLSDISFSVKQGEIIAILGKSGSGKTTLLNILSQLETASSGTSEYKGKVSYTPQRDLLLPWRILESNVYLPLEIEKSLDENSKNKVAMFLKEMGLYEFRKSYPNELSGGMRQKVSLIRSLIQEKPVYLFDEALSAIDFDSRLKLVKKIRSYIKNGNKIGVFVTHNIEEAISIADKIIVFSERPAKVIYESNINIDENSRDPVIIRKNEEFQRQFETIWKVMT